MLLERAAARVRGRRDGARGSETTGGRPDGREGRHWTGKMMHPRYEEWLQHVFAHPVTEPAWHFSLDAPDFVAGEQDIVELLAQTFSHAGRDLSAYTDAQVNQGIRYLASPSCSDYMFALRDGNVPVEPKVEGVRSIRILFAECFAVRCAQTLIHLDEQGQSDLNPICYIF